MPAFFFLQKQGMIAQYYEHWLSSEKSGNFYFQFLQIIHGYILVKLGDQELFGHPKIAP